MTLSPALQSYANLSPIDLALRGVRRVMYGDIGNMILERHHLHNAADELRTAGRNTLADELDSIARNYRRWDDELPAIEERIEGEAR